jgi:hypothetical protein
MSSTRRSRQLSGTPTEHVAAVEAYRDEFDRDMKQFYR